MGLKGLKTHEVTLENCRVGAEARLGGEGGTNFARLLSESRVAMAAMAVGVAHAAFDYARDYAKERKAFGVPIATKQAVAFMLADMAIEIDAARLLVWEAAWHLDSGEDAHQGELSRAQLCRGSIRAQGCRQRGSGAGRSRLYPRTSGRDVAAQCAWVRRPRWTRHGVTGPT